MYPRYVYVKVGDRYLPVPAPHLCKNLKSSSSTSASLVSSRASLMGCPHSSAMVAVHTVHRARESLCVRSMRVSEQ